MVERPREYSIPGFFRDTRELADMIKPALASLPASAVSEFMERLAEAAVAHTRGDEDALGQLFFGVVAEYRLSLSPSYRQATKEIDQADELGPPQEIDRSALFAELRARG
jgi:hypothetical protein